MTIDGVHHYAVGLDIGGDGMPEGAPDGTTDLYVTLSDQEFTTLQEGTFDFNTI